MQVNALWRSMVISLTFSNVKNSQKEGHHVSSPSKLPFHPLFYTQRWLVGSESDTAIINMNFDQISYACDIPSKIEYGIID